MIVSLRIAGDPLAFADSLEKTIHQMNADVLVFDVTPLAVRTQISSFAQRVAGTFVGSFGLLALVLAAVGTYGVTGYTTRQRAHEMGVRMALGATRQNILHLVLGYGVKLMVAGIGIGLALSLGLTRFLSGLLLGTTSRDALTFISVALLLCAVALLACLIPARGAMHLDPMVALRD
jgi:ABC-type antimicrobial peptide transport system permease subunit